jgi:hypothetical protein
MRLVGPKFNVEVLTLEPTVLAEKEKKNKRKAYHQQHRGGECEWLRNPEIVSAKFIPKSL